jgi:hypothetical protein
MYGNGAFYDLNATGFQATLANNLPVDETCVVASRGPMGNVSFDWYRFVRETVTRDNTGVPCRAFFGKHFKTETLARREAIGDGSIHDSLTSTATSSDVLFYGRN